MNHEKIGQATFSGDLAASVAEAVGQLGGFGRFIALGDRVLLKVNCNTADAFPASSDAAFVAAVADACQAAGAAEVTIADSSTLVADTRRVMEQTGLTYLAETRPWLRVSPFDSGRWVQRDVVGGKYLKCISVPAALDDFEKVIFLPCLKTHKYAQYTGALKLAIGFMKKGERLALHAGHLQEKIGELASVIRPHLVIMDARRCFITGGPFSGEVREPNLILAGTNRIDLDKEGVRIIQQYPGNALAKIAPEDLPQIRRAIEMGVDAT
ncbi:MAG: DUF362 domain-containing protein [Patescibacteria group bacterium]|nr:DUF362 domain-containing protein [Patescibacteria group bacterium]